MLRQAVAHLRYGAPPERERELLEREAPEEEPRLDAHDPRDALPERRQVTVAQREQKHRAAAYQEAVFHHPDPEGGRPSGLSCVRAFLAARHFVPQRKRRVKHPEYRRDHDPVARPVLKRRRSKSAVMAAERPDDQYKEAGKAGLAVDEQEVQHHERDEPQLGKPREPPVPYDGVAQRKAQQEAGVMRIEDKAERIVSVVFDQPDGGEEEHGGHDGRSDRKARFEHAVLPLPLRRDGEEQQQPAV